MGFARDKKAIKSVTWACQFGARQEVRSGKSTLSFLAGTSLCNNPSIFPPPSCLKKYIRNTFVPSYPHVTWRAGGEWGAAPRPQACQARPTPFCYQKRTFPHALAPPLRLPPAQNNMRERRDRESATGPHLARTPLYELPYTTAPGRQTARNATYCVDFEPHIFDSLKSKQIGYLRCPFEKTKLLLVVCLQLASFNPSLSHLDSY